MFGFIVCIYDKKYMDLVVVIYSIIIIKRFIRGKCFFFVKIMINDILYLLILFKIMFNV